MGKQGKRRRRLGEQDRGIAPKALFNIALMMGAYFPCAVAITSLSHTHTHIPSHTPSASRSDISSLSFLLHFCPVLLPSHSPLLLRSISSDSRLSATLTNTYYVQSAHVCEHPASPSLNVCSYNASIQNRYESMYQASRCLAIFLQP